MKDNFPRSGNNEISCLIKIRSRSKVENKQLNLFNIYSVIWWGVGVALEKEIKWSQIGEFYQFGLFESKVPMQKIRDEVYRIIRDIENLNDVTLMLHILGIHHKKMFESIFPFKGKINSNKLVDWMKFNI